jgi:hypothetical protein
MPEIKAIFYSVSELGSVLVEIHGHDKTFFISTDNVPTAFANIEIAKKIALKHGATVGLMALTKTYEEVNFVDDNDQVTRKSRYDYLPISLK